MVSKVNDLPGPVHTYPDTFESANFFRIEKFPLPHVSGYESNQLVHTYLDSL